MNSAYAVLGLGAEAGIEDIKNTYQRLMQLLDLSHYEGTPLAELASQRRSETSHAFQQLMNIMTGLDAPAAASPSSGLNTEPSSWLFIGPGLNDPQQQGGWCSRTCDSCGNCCECLSDCGDCCSGCD